MAEQPSGGGPLRFQQAPGTYVLVACMLAAAMVALLWVPSYAKATPTLAGFPFFYWYSLLWLLLNAALQFGAYRLFVVRPRRQSQRAISADRGEVQS
ncbi:MAG: DUF3311 domain-containing protein [Actinomycetota bacterium]|nr:DUF3311 domain-containing protein [Actinomycetota bacterium]